MYQEGLTKAQEYLLSVLKENGGWMNRRELGEATGLYQLAQPFYIDLLDDLEARGLIEIEKEKIGMVRTRYIYRAL